MLDEDEVGVLGKAVAAALAENLSADPVVKGLRTFVQTHPALGTTKLTDECLVRYYLSRKENYDKTKKALGRLLQWRQEQDIDKISVQTLSTNPDAQTAVVGTGPCTKNRPCVWVYACRHNKDSQTDAEMRLFLACKIEEALSAGERLREEERERQAAEALEETLSGNSEEAATQAAVAAGHAAKLAEEGGGSLSRYRNIDTCTLVFDLRDFGMSNMNYDAISTLVNLCTYQVSPVYVLYVLCVQCGRTASELRHQLPPPPPPPSCSCSTPTSSRGWCCSTLPGCSTPAGPCSDRCCRRWWWIWYVCVRMAWTCDF